MKMIKMGRYKTLSLICVIAGMIIATYHISTKPKIIYGTDFPYLEVEFCVQDYIAQPMAQYNGSVHKDAFVEQIVDKSLMKCAPIIDELAQMMMTDITYTDKNQTLNLAKQAIINQMRQDYIAALSDDFDRFVTFTKKPPAPEVVLQEAKDAEILDEFMAEKIEESDEKYNQIIAIIDNKI